MEKMKLAEFQIFNFRSIRDSRKISCYDLTTFLGKPNSGKTNILLALKKFNSDIDQFTWFKEDIPKDDIKSQYYSIESKKFVTCKFRIENKNFKRQISELLKIKNLKFIEITKYYNGTYSFKVKNEDINISNILKKIYNELDITKKFNKDHQYKIAIPEKLFKQKLNNSKEHLKKWIIDSLNKTIEKEDKRNLFKEVEKWRNFIKEIEFYYKIYDLFIHNLPYFYYYPYDDKNYSFKNFFQLIEYIYRKTTKYEFDTIINNIIILSKELGDSSNKMLEGLTKIIETDTSHDNYVFDLSVGSSFLETLVYKKGIFEKDNNNAKFNFNWILNLYLMSLSIDFEGDPGVVFLLDRVDSSMSWNTTETLIFLINKLIKKNQIICTAESSLLLTQESFKKTKEVYLMGKSNTIIFNSPPKNTIKLKKYRIMNFRSIIDTSINKRNIFLKVNKLNGLVGMNQMGKSSVLMALFSLNPLDNSYNSGEKLEINKPANNLKYDGNFIECTFSIETKNLILYVKKSKKFIKDNIRESIIEFVVSKDYKGILKIISFNNLFHKFFEKDVIKKAYYKWFLKHENLEIAQKLQDLFNEYNTLLDIDVVNESWILIDKYDRYFENYFNDYIKNNLSASSNKQEILEWINKAQIAINLLRIKVYLINNIPKFRYLNNYFDSIKSKHLYFDRNLVNRNILDEIPEFIIRNFKIKENEFSKTYFKNKNKIINNVTNFEDFSIEFSSFMGEKYEIKQEININDSNFFQNDFFKHKLLVNDFFDKNISLENKSFSFQWLLSFFIHFYKYKQNYAFNEILLLDELGTSLHPNTQRRIVDFLNELSERNQIFYTTHLPFLVNENQVQNYDIVYRDAKQKNINKNKEKIVFLNINGDNKVIEIIDLLNSFKKQVLIILDSDGNWKKIKKILKENGVSEDLIYTLNLIDISVKKIEDLVGIEFIKKAILKTRTSITKKEIDLYLNKNNLSQFFKKHNIKKKEIAEWISLQIKNNKIFFSEEDLNRWKKLFKWIYEKIKLI